MLLSGAQLEGVYMAAPTPADRVCRNCKHWLAGSFKTVGLQPWATAYGWCLHKQSPLRMNIQGPMYPGSAGPETHEESTCNGHEPRPNPDKK